MQSSTNYPRNWLFALAAAAMALFALNLLRGDPQLDQDALVPGAASEKIPDAVDGLPVAAPGRSSVLEPRGSSLSITGSVLDARFGTPVRASVCPENSECVVTTEESGGFQVMVSGRGKPSLRVSAFGYQSQRVTIDTETDLRPFEIFLEPQNPSRVTVRSSDGSAVVGRVLQWRASTIGRRTRDNLKWFDSHTHAAGAQVITRTDAAGNSELTLSVPATVDVLSETGAVGATLRLQPGEHVELILTEGALTLTLIENDSDRPLAGMQVETWKPLDPRSTTRSYETDSMGVIRIPASPTPVFVKPLLSDEAPRLRVVGGSAAASATLSADPGVIRLPHAMDGEELLIEVTLVPVRDRARLELVNEIDGTAVTGPAHVTLRRTVPVVTSDGRPRELPYVRMPRSIPKTISTLRNGELLVPPHVMDELNRVPESLSEMELVVTVDGFLPLHLADVRSVLLPGQTGTTHSMKPAPHRWVKVSHADGSAYRGRVAVYSPHHHAYCYNSEVGDGGVFGPFDWLGGDIEVITEVMGRSPRQPAQLVPASNLDLQEKISITLPSRTGSIAVKGVPAFSSALGLVALRYDSGIEYPPTSTGESDCRFDGLPIGKYAVGPRDWLRGALANSRVTHGVFSSAESTQSMLQVRAGVVTTAQWQHAWAAASDLRGRVRIVGSAGSEPLLIPVYGIRDPASGIAWDPVPSVIVSAARRTVPLEDAGWYRIRAGEPVPDLIAVCLPDSAGWCDINAVHLVATIEPGESIEIPTGSIVLSWEGDPLDADLGVRYRVGRPDLRWQVRGPLVWSNNTWSTETELILHGVPTCVQSVSVSGKSIPIRLSANETLRLALDSSVLENATDYEAED